jgi:hypothetical protein
MERSIFDTIVDQPVSGNEKQSLLDTITYPEQSKSTTINPIDTIVSGKEDLITGNPQAAGRFGVGDSRHDWGIYDEQLLDLNNIRAAHQGPGEQFLAFANQATVGQILGGGIEGVGYLLDIEGNAKLIAGTEKEFGNWFSDIGKKLQTWTEEATPIYADDRQAKFAPNHWSWWMQNGKSVMSTLSLMLPAAGAFKGITAIGKAVGAWQKLSPLAKWAATGLGEAAISRHMESMQEAAGVYKEAYQTGVTKGLSDNDAKEYAARAASKDYTLNWAMYLQDVPQYLLLNTAFGKTVGKVTDKSIKAASMLGHDIAPMIAKKGLAIGADMLGEGFEEGYQYIIGEESKYLTEKIRDPKSTSSFDDRLVKYLKDGEFWTNAAMGALGAGVMQTAGKAVNDMIMGGDPQARFVKEFGTKVSQAAQAVHVADLLGKESGKDAAITNLEATLFSNGSALQMMDDVKELINRTADANDPVLQQLGVTPEDLETLKLNSTEILKHADEYSKLWEKNAKQYDLQKAADVTNAEFKINSYNTRIQDYKNRLGQLNPQITNYHKLSEEAQTIFGLSSEILAKQKTVDFQQKRLDDTKNPLEPRQRELAQKLIDVTNKSINRLKADLTHIDKSRDPETRKEDNAVDIGGKYNLLEIKDSKEITSHPIIEHMQLNDALAFTEQTLSATQQHLKEVLNKKEAVKPVEPIPADDLTRVPDTDDYVLFTKDGTEYTGMVDHMDENGDYVVIPTTKWSEQSKYATKPTGESLVVSKDNVKLDYKQYAEEDIVDESIATEDALIEDNEEVASNKYLDVSYMYRGEDNKPVVTNEELHKFLIDSKNSLEGVIAEMHIDTTSEYATELFKKAGLNDKQIAKLRKGKLTDNDINELFTHITVDSIPVSILLVKDGKTVLSNNAGIFYHTTDFASKTVPAYIQDRGKETVDKYIANQKQRIRQNRFKIITNLLQGNEVYSDTLYTTNGWFNNGETRGNILERHGLAIADGRLAVSRRNGKIYASNSNIIAGVTAGTAGNIFAPTKKTITGKQAWAKVNPNKLTKEHAEILWDAIKTRYTKGKGALAEFPDNRVEGLNVGEVITMLTLFGERKTNIDHKGYKGEGREDLRKKTLYVHSARELMFGTTTIDIHEYDAKVDAANKKAFIKWATENKNYSIPLAVKSMGIELNSPLKRTFKIGSWENKADKKGNFLTTAQFLMSVPVDGKKAFAVVSDIQEYENTGSVMVRPNLMLGDNSNAIKVVQRQTIKTPPKQTTKSKARKAAVKKVSNKPTRVDSPMDIIDLPVGSVLYYNDPVVEDRKITDKVVKTVLAEVINDKSLGRVLDLRKVKFLTKEVGDWLILDAKEAPASLDTVVSGLKSYYASGVYIDVSGTDETVKEEPVEVKEIVLSIEDRIKGLDDVNKYPGIKELRKIYTGGGLFFNVNTNDYNEIKDQLSSHKITADDIFNVRNNFAGEFGGYFERGFKILTGKTYTEYANLLTGKSKVEEPVSDKDVEETLKDMFGVAMLANFAYPVKSIIDLQKELEWLYSRFGHIDVKESDKLLRLAADGRQAFSIFTADCIYVYTGAPEGAIYHEAFHRVTLGYLNPSDRQKVFEAGRKYLNMPSATDAEISEALAQDFRQYKLNGTKPQSRTVWQFFKDLYQFIKAFFTGNNSLTTYEIDKLYDSINRHHFKYNKITEENRSLLNNIQTPMAVEIKKKPISFINNYHDLDKIVKFLTSILITTNNIDSLNDIKHIQMSKMWEDVERRITVLTNAINLTQRQLDENLIPEDQIENKKQMMQVATNLLNILQAVKSKDYRDLFVDKIKDMLVKFNVKRIQSEDSELEDLKENNYKAYYDKASYEINSKDNILASVKFLIATLPKQGTLDPIMGIPEMVDFNDMWNSLMHNLYGIEDVQEMMDRLSENADKYPYKALIDKLNADKTGDIKQQLRTAVQKHRHNFINFLLTMGKEGTVPKIEISNADVRSASNQDIKEWNFTFYGLGFAVASHEALVIDKDKVDRLWNDFDAFQKKVEKEYATSQTFKDRAGIISTFVSLLNRIGVYVDETSIDSLVSKRQAENLDDALLQTIIADFSHIFEKIRDVNPDNARHIFNDEKHMRALADADIESHPEKISDMVLGPSNNQYFVYSQNSHVSDMVRKFRNDKTYLEEHLNKIYNDNSYYGQQMLADDKVREGLELMSFAMFGQRGTAGNDYLNINPIEDYIFKMVAMSRGYIPFPTMADRKMYYMLKGIQPFKFNYKPTETGHVMPSEAIDIILGYAKSERKRIIEAQRVIDEYEAAKKDGNKERIQELENNLVENYHYKVVGGKKNTSKDNANALRYHNFPSFNREGFDFDTMAREEIRVSLINNIKEELDYLEELGVIGSTLDATTNKKKYYNKLIPNGKYDTDIDLLKEGVDNYNSADMAIKNFVASHTINTIIANNEVEKLFSGDPAFFKQDKDTKRVVEDRVKRLSVLTSTGDNFANNVEEHDLNDAEFNVSTIATQKFQSAYYEQLEQWHLDNQRKQISRENPSLSKEEVDSKAKVIVHDLLKAYREIDSTDGQAWISPAMYRSLSIRLGEWPQEKQEAFDLLQLDRELTLEEEQKVLNVTFQPLKLVYFNLIHSGNLAIPTFHKASFATIFRTMGQGKYGNRQIIDMLDRMEGKGKYQENPGEERLEKVDMFVMDSATKVGNRSKFNLFDDKLETIQDLSNLVVYKQPFMGLRRQLVTDAHDVDRTKTGTQFLKIVLGNLNLTDDVYSLNGKRNGKYIREAAFSSLKELSNRGRKQLEDKLGYKNGKVEKKKLVALLSEDAKMSNASDNLVDAIMMMGEDEMYLELDALTDRKWIQSRIISLISKFTVDVELPGNQLIQFSNYGVRSINTQYTFEKELSEKDKHVTWIKNATDDLKWMTLENGSVVPMGCIVSINLFKHIIPNYDEISYADKIKYLEDNPEIMGYRIPTQGQNSVFMMKVAGVYPETIGDTITLPSEFTALTGSDFDIDKVFVVRYNYSVDERDKSFEKIKFLEGDTNSDKFLEKIYKDRYGVLIRKWKHLNEGAERYDDAFTNHEIDILNQMRDISDDEEIVANIDKLLKYNRRVTEWWNEINANLLHYNLDKFVNENKGKDIYEVNSKKAVQNRLIDTFFAVMRSEEHFNLTSIPLGGLTDKLKKKAQDIRSAQDMARPDMYYQSPRFNEDVKFTYNGGKDGIGPFALNNVHHILAQLAELKMRGTFGDVMYTEDKLTDLSKHIGKDGVYISNWLSALIDAHVDVAKDPYIMDLNVNSFTYNVTALLIRGGVGMETFNFLAQPILKQLAHETLLSDKNSALKKVLRLQVDTDSEGDPIYRYFKPLDYVKYIWRSKLTDVELAEIDKLPAYSAFNDKLEGDLTAKKDSDDKAFIKRQVLVLKAFEELNKMGTNLNTLVQASQIDTKRFGSNITELRVFLNKIRRAYDLNVFVNIEDILPYDVNTGQAIDSPNANFLGTYAENAINFSLDVMSDFSIYATPVFDELFNKLVELTGNKFTIDSKFVNVVSDEIFAAIVSRYFTDPNGPIHMDSKMFSTLMKKVPERLWKMKSDPKFADLKDNMFIKYLYLEGPTDELIKEILPMFITVPMKSVKDKLDKDNMIDSFKELLKDNRQEVKDLARQLYYYAFFTSGYRSRIYSFYNLLPNEMARELQTKTELLNGEKSYNGFIKKVLNEMHNLTSSLAYNSIIDEVIINNHDHDNLVKLINDRSIEHIVPYYKESNKNKSTLAGVVIGHEAGTYLYLGKNDNEELIFRPYIKVQDPTLGHVLMKYIGYLVDNSDPKVILNKPVYVAIDMRSYSSRGVVLKEFNMDKSFIPAYNNINQVSQAEEDLFLNHLSQPGTLYEKGTDFMYIPKEDQLVLTGQPTIGFDENENIVEQSNTEENGLQGKREEKEVDEFPFITSPQDKFSTESKPVSDLVNELGILDWASVTKDEWARLKDAYKHCKL